MPSIHLQTAHSLGVSSAKQRISKVAEQLKSRLGVDYRWEGNELRFNRTGANGSILVEDKLVTTDIELGMMLTPFKSEVQKQVQSYLEQNLQ